MIKEYVTVINSRLEEVSEKITRILLENSGLYGLYASLPYSELLLRVKATLGVALQALESDSSAPLKNHLNRIYTMRLKAGYDPNSMLRLIDLMAREMVATVEAVQPVDKSVVSVLRRRLGFLTSVAKMHLATLNMSIPPEERNEIDPALLKMSDL
jgi:hypothetical protein